MKKLMIIALVALFVITGCSSKDSGGKTEKHIEDLKVVFVPSRDPKEITTATEPLKELLIAELAKSGYTVDKVTIDVSPKYEAAGETLDAGTAHVGFLPGGTYALYSKDGNIDVILAATRDGLNKDSAEAKDWNDGKATTAIEEQVTYYRSLIYAGTSETGRALAKKVNAGEKLTWDELDAAKWCVSSPTSSAGYVYPALWLSENFDGKMVSDLKNAVQVTGYPDTAARLANGQCDVGVGYADIRRDYEENWTKEWGKTDIWSETDVIGVTEGIMNDTISISKELVDADFAKALQDAFIAIAKTEAGAEAISIYNHIGYKVVTDKDYDAARSALDLVK